LDRLRHRPNVATGLQAINTVRKDRSHVTAGQYFSLHQVLQQGKRGRSIGNRNALGVQPRKLIMATFIPVWQLGKRRSDH